MSAESSKAGILERILDRKRDEVQAARLARPVSDLRREPRYRAVRRSMRESLENHSPAILAECKRRSPSKGLLRDPYDPVAIARRYHFAGAAGISVLTDHDFFGGCLEDLTRVRDAVPLPVLRKDFIVDEYQIEEARAAGADIVLLICAALSADALHGLRDFAASVGLEVLVEVHDEAEMEVAISLAPELIGVNNRNLRTFVTDLSTTERLSRCAPKNIPLIAESGIAAAADLQRLRRSGVDAFLVGESFMRCPDPGAPVGEWIAAVGPQREPID